MADSPSVLTLDELIEAVRVVAPNEPIDQLAAAARLKEILDERGDALLGHFVDQARVAGHSWSDIGGALGVTKQAVQQRHGTPATQGRFTPRAANVLDHAASHAIELGHGFVGTEHLLLGICSEPESIGAKVLSARSVGLDRVRDAVVERIGRGSAAGTEPVMTPQAKRALEATLAQALALGHNYVGTEHQLLGLLTMGDGLAHDILIEAGITHESARQAVVHALTGLGELA